MFITKKALREKIEEAIAKEREREAINERIDRCGRDFIQEIQWLRRDYDNAIAGMNARISKLEGNPAKEVRKDEAD